MCTTWSMKTLVIITHPNFEQSVVNKRWTEELQGLADVTVHKLHGKELMFAVSTGAPKENYHAEGSNKYTVEELLRPLEATGNLIGTLVLPPFIQYGMMGISAREYAKAVLA